MLAVKIGVCFTIRFSVSITLFPVWLEVVIKTEIMLVINIESGANAKLLFQNRMIGSIKGSTLVQKGEDNSFIPFIRRDVDYLIKDRGKGVSVE